MRKRQKCTNLFADLFVSAIRSRSCVAQLANEFLKQPAFEMNLHPRYVLGMTSPEFELRILIELTTLSFH